MLAIMTVDSEEAAGVKNPFLFKSFVPSFLPSFLHLFYFLSIQGPHFGDRDGGLRGRCREKSFPFQQSFVRSFLPSFVLLSVHPGTPLWRS